MQTILSPLILHPLCTQIVSLLVGALRTALTALPVRISCFPRAWVEVSRLHCNFADILELQCWKANWSGAGREFAVQDVLWKFNTGILNVTDIAKLRMAS